MRQCFENHNETGSLIEKKEYYFCLIIDIFTRARINELLLLKNYRLANEFCPTVFSHDVIKQFYETFKYLFVLITK